VDNKSLFMVVKIRFGHGSVVARRKGKNKRIALLVAAFFTMVAICCASLGMWRFSQDIGLASGDFVFQDGLLSHWQVWFAAAAAIQYGCWRLGQYALRIPRNAVAESGIEDSKPSSTLAANV
jgi:hypothetical protein